MGLNLCFCDLLWFTGTLFADYDNTVVAQPYQPFHRGLDIRATYPGKYHPEKFAVALIAGVEVVRPKPDKSIYRIAGNPERPNLHPVGPVRICVDDRDRTWLVCRHCLLCRCRLCQQLPFLLVFQLRCCGRRSYGTRRKNDRRLWGRRNRCRAGCHRRCWNNGFHQAWYRYLYPWHNGNWCRRFRRNHHRRLGRRVLRLGRMEYVYRYWRIGRHFQWERSRPDMNRCGRRWRRRENRLSRWSRRWLDYLHRLCLDHLYRLRLHNRLGRRHWGLNPGRESRLGPGRTNRFNYYRCGAGNKHVQMLGGRHGNVDDTPFHKRPPVVHPDRNLPVVVSVGNHQKRSERQRWMGCGKLGGIENLPRCGGPSVELGAVPGGDTFLSETLSRWNRGRLGRQVLWNEQDGDKAGKYRNTYASHTTLIGISPGFIHMNQTSPHLNSDAGPKGRGTADLKQRFPLHLPIALRKAAPVETAIGLHNRCFSIYFC